MTKAAFLAAYETELLARFDWAASAPKRDKFMNSVRNTLYGHAGASWNHDGAACTAAWKAIGGMGKPSLKALKALEN